MQRHIFIFAAFAGFLSVSQFAYSQNIGGTRSSSGFGNTGGTGFGNTGTTGLGGSSFGTNSGFGGSGVGTSGFGGPGFGNQSGFGDGQQNGFGNQNQFGANQNGGILGRNNNQNQLLGRNQQGMMQGNFDNNFNNFGRGNAGRGNRNLGLNQLNNQNQSANSSQTPLVRPRQAVGFDFPRNRPSAVQSHLETRLAKQSKRHAGLSSVTVVVDDQGNVILQGTVKSPADRKLAENLIYLEPGIKKVRNELTIESDTPAHPEG